MTEDNKKMLEQLRVSIDIMYDEGTIEGKRHKIPLGYYAALCKDAIKLIDDQDVTIRALMGEFGDSCSVDGCEGDEA